MWRCCGWSSRRCGARPRRSAREPRTREPIGLLTALISRRLAPGAGWLRASPRWRDLGLLVATYLVIVALFRVAFGVFTAASVAGLFAAFAGGLLVGVGGPIVHVLGIRHGRLAELGLTRDRLPATVALGLGLAALQAALMFPTVTLGAPEAWFPPLVMALAGGLFEAVFFRGYVLAILGPSFGLIPAVAVSAGLYALYHVGYGMGAEEMVFLAGLGIVHAITFALVRNVLVLWPLLTPLGGFAANLRVLCRRRRGKDPPLSHIGCPEAGCTGKGA